MAVTSALPATAAARSRELELLVELVLMADEPERESMAPRLMLNGSAPAQVMVQVFRSSQASDPGTCLHQVSASPTSLIRRNASKRGSTCKGLAVNVYGVLAKSFDNAAALACVHEGLRTNTCQDQEKSWEITQVLVSTHGGGCAAQG